MTKSDAPELSSTLSQTLPMAAIFMRNRYVGWYDNPALIPSTRPSPAIIHRLHTCVPCALLDGHRARGCRMA